MVVVLGVGDDLLVGELVHHLGDRALLVGLLGVLVGGYGHWFARAPGVAGFCCEENTGVNFTSEIVDGAPADAPALVELSREGSRREWSFGELSERAARLAGTFARHGAGRGEVVMTLIGNRPEWVLAMLACFRTGAVVLPCTEQLRAKDLRLRIEVARPALIIADERNRAELELAAPEAEVLLIPDETLFAGEPAPAAELEPEEPALITFTSGTAGEPKAVVHAQRYLLGQRLQASSWLAAGPGELVWCTAASGWSKSARNVFMAPWLTGAVALLHDARFDPHERLELLERERVNVLCMAPTEYRVIAKRAEPAPLPDLRGMVAAGEALNPEVLRTWEEATGLQIRDGYGQTETGQLTGSLPGEPRPARIDGPRPAGRRARDRGRRAGTRARHRPDLLPRLPRRGGPPRAVAPAAGRRVGACARPQTGPAGTPVTVSAATRTAGCTSRAGPTT